MSQNRKRLAIAAALFICAAAAAGLSKPGKAAIIKLMAALDYDQGGAASSSLSSQSGQDKEQRAKTKHGWTGPVSSSVVRGAITYFKNDLVVKQASLTVYHKYPERMRVDVEHQGVIQTWGFGPGGPWQARADSLTEEELRDIRGWMRLWPERLFLTRGAGRSYREMGHRVEDTGAGSPAHRSGHQTARKVMDQVEVEDLIGQGARADRRLVTYLIDRESSIVSSARWLEPDDPLRSIDEADAPKVEVRVDFGGWRRVDGVLWPTEITRFVGGRADVRIDISEVLVNEQLPSSLFLDPSK